MHQKNRLLKEKVDYILQQLYGAKSEKLDSAQLELLFDPDEAKKPCASDCEEDALAAKNIVPFTKNQSRKNNPRPRLPHNLQTTEEIIIPDEVKASPENYRQIGQEISEKLNVEPSRYTRHLIIHPT